MRCICVQYDYVFFLRFYVYIFVGLLKHGVLTLVGVIQCYGNDRYYYDTEGCCTEGSDIETALPVICLPRLQAIQDHPCV